MVINQEFFFRGWLPAGLLINARLITTAPPRTGQAVLKPIINPIPGAGWPIDQPLPVFPVEQATDTTAIVLADPLLDGTIALLPQGRWYGSGTPYVLGLNTWYEGRVRIITGSDVMAVRIMAPSVLNYYSNYDGLSEKDVAASLMACRHITGRSTEQVLLPDGDLKAASTIAFAPTVTIMGNEIPARVMSRVSVTPASFAGVRKVYSELNVGATLPFLQCEITDGKIIGGAKPKYVGMVLSPQTGAQKFFSLSNEGIIDVIGVITGREVAIGTVAISTIADQVVHYN